MQDMTQLYQEYDDIVIGKRPAFSDRFFSGEGNPKTNMENAIFVIRYALTKYLRWNADAMAANLNKEVMTRMHLQPLMKYVEYPLEYDKENDWFYLVSLIFKDKRIGLRQKTIHTYECVLSGELAKYPRDYFVGSDGVVKAAICLQYLLNEKTSYETINDLYYAFASDEGYELLRDNKLLNACKEIFETPVEFLHFSLPPDMRDEFLRQYYSFKYVREMLNEKGRKRKSAAEYRLEVDEDDYSYLREELQD